MRETLWFFASFAGAAILTALAALLSPASPFWRGIFFGAAYVLFVCAALIFLDMRRSLKERERMIPLVGMIVFGLAFAGCAIWYFWPQEAAVTAGQTTAVELYADCRMQRMRAKTSADGRLYAVFPYWAGASGGFSVITSSPNEEYTFFGDEIDKVNTIYECSVLNYSDHPLFSVGLDLRVVLVEAVRQTDGEIKSGKFIKDETWPLTINKIDSGKENPFIFYIINRTDHFVFAWLKSTGRAEQFGGAGIQGMRIAGDTDTQMSLQPLTIPHSHP